MVDRKKNIEEGLKEIRAGVSKLEGRFGVQYVRIGEIYSKLHFLNRSIATLNPEEELQTLQSIMRLQTELVRWTSTSRDAFSAVQKDFSVFLDDLYQFATGLEKRQAAEEGRSIYHSGISLEPNYNMPWNESKSKYGGVCLNGDPEGPADVCSIM